ncbi:MAG: MaoC family dehydratase N-terminal domain-containing protein [Gammaproteobacteria bacterium]|jgi:acyl dehydratase|nr:MaoC family dehydratase N-terminal domain-containing protein [Gammaproteobacteria bacterium]
MIDRKFIGSKAPPFEAEIEKGRLRLFAKAIGETDPIYSDESTARAAGYRSIPVPPTFLFCLEMEQPDPYRWFREMGIPLPHALHGGQAFRYLQTACAGDVLTFNSEVADIYDKKGGELEFVVQDVTITDQNGEPVADFRRTVVIRNV